MDNKTPLDTLPSGPAAGFGRVIQVGGTAVSAPRGRS